MTDTRTQDLPAKWRAEAVQGRQEAGTYSPRGAKQARLRGEAGALERCADELEAALERA